MHRLALGAAALLSFFTLTGCPSVVRDSPKKLSDYDRGALTFYACGMDIDTEANEELSYEGEITDPDVIDSLWEIIVEQCGQPEIKGGNYLSGTPCLIVYGPRGESFTVSYTWDREEQTVDDCGEPGTMHAGDAFVIAGKYGGKYEITSQEERGAFNDIINGYLRDNVTPEERVWQKTDGTDLIVFVSLYQNAAWGHQCGGSFIDCYGNMYTFDFSGEFLDEDFDLKDALWEVYCDTDPVRRGLCGSDRMVEVLTDDVYDIDADAEVSSEHCAYDRGQTTLYVCDCDFNMIMLRSLGDYEERLKDSTAKKLCKLYDEITK